MALAFLRRQDNLVPSFFPGRFIGHGCGGLTDGGAHFQPHVVVAFSGGFGAAVVPSDQFAHFIQGVL